MQYPDFYKVPALLPLLPPSLPPLRRPPCISSSRPTSQTNAYTRPEHTTSCSYPSYVQDARRTLGSGRRNAAHPSFESLDAFFCDCLERVEAAYATLDKACKVGKLLMICVRLASMLLSFLCTLMVQWPTLCTMMKMRCKRYKFT